MVRQYKIHTDLDGSNNKIYDMTNGQIRFYQPSDLGIVNSTNIWQSQGIGVMGNNNISHPDIDFKFETFGNSLEENYRIFNEFINDIIKQKYITLEYTNEIGTYFADIQLSKITKTEGYGFDGTFSESISFIPVNMWYQYEQLKFSKIQNGVIGGNTKIYGNKETTVYPNLNLLDGTKDFSGNWANSSSWVTDGTYKGLTVKKRTEQWGGINKIFTAPKDDTYTFSAYIKSSGNTANIVRFGQVNDQDIVGIVKLIGNNFDWTRDTVTLNLKANDSVWIRYEISGNGTDSILWVAGYKWEPGSVATPYMESSSEVTTSDYPSYIGTYLDSNVESSSDYKRYQWAIFKGQNSNAYTAYSWSADGTDRFSTTKPNLNLLDGTTKPFIMGYGIPNTTWDTTNQVSGISLPITVSTWGEVLPLGNGFLYNYIPGVTYTQSIYISTDAPLTGTPISFTWFTGKYGHNMSGVDNLVKVSNNVYRATSTITWPSSNSSEIGRNADLMNLTQVFDFTKGTFLQFYRPKLELGSTATPWMLSSSEVQPSDYRNYGSYKYGYTYFGEDNIERFSKWSIDDGIFSFTARVVPSEKMSTPPTTNGKNYYGVRFLDEQFNEYTAITFESNTKPESIQFNTDVNDEYYQAQIGTSTINVFSSLDYQRFRTRILARGTMELVNVDFVEMNVKRKVEFV